jgi:hypothetical protein
VVRGPWSIVMCCCLGSSTDPHPRPLSPKGARGEIFVWRMAGMYVLALSLGERVPRAGLFTSRRRSGEGSVGRQLESTETEIQAISRHDECKGSKLG